MRRRADVMNERHLALCGSTEWFDAVRDLIVPWAIEGVALGEDVLEIGPGVAVQVETNEFAVGFAPPTRLDLRRPTGCAFAFQLDGIDEDGCLDLCFEQVAEVLVDLGHVGRGDAEEAEVA